MKSEIIDRPIQTRQRFQEDTVMKYDEKVCHFNMDTGCVELLLRDGRKISIDCTGVEDALDVTMAQRSELDYLIYNDHWAMSI